MSYTADDDAHENYELREKIRKLEEIVHDIYIPQSENVGPTYRNLIGYSFGTPNNNNGGNSGGQTGSGDSDKIKNYGTVTGVVTIDQSFRSHVMTLGDDITIQFDDNVNSENIKELFFEIIQPAGENYSISWDDKVKTVGSIKILNNASIDVSNFLVGFSNDGGETYIISPIGAKKVILNDSGLNPENLPVGSIPIDKINNFSSNVTSEIDKWISVSAQSGLKWLQENHPEIQSNLETAYEWVNDSANNIHSEINKWLDLTANESLKFFNDLSSSTRTQITNAASWVNDAASNILSEITKWINLASNQGLQWVNNLGESIQEKITNAAGWVDSSVNNVKSIINNAVSEIESALGSTYTNIKNWINSATTNVNNLINSALASGSTIFNNIVSAVSGTVSDIVALITSNASDVADALKSNLDSFYVDVNSFATKTSTEINKWLNEASQAGIKFFNDLSSSTRTQITNAASWVNDAASNILSEINNALNSGGVILNQITSSLSGYATQAWVDAKGFLSGISESIKNAILNISGSSNSTNYEIITGNKISKDIDMLTHDVLGIDRAYFNSNDEVDAQSIYPHISGKGSGNTRSFNVFSPSTIQFFIGSSNALNIDSSRIYTLKELYANQKIIATEDVEMYETCVMRESISAGFAPSGVTDKAIIFCRPSSSGRTEMRVKFKNTVSKLLAEDT